MRKQTKIAAMVSAATLLTMGAAMTSLASGWAKEGEDFVYLDRYGDRVVNEWKKDGDGWFYLGDDGYMVTSQLLTDTGSNGEIYYVNSAGRKVTNTWVGVDNEDGFVLPGGDEPSTVYYYFDASGKAIKSGSGDEYKSKKLKKSNDSSEQAYFLFDDQGHMMSGWIHNGGNTGDEDLYYLGSEDEGWARTGFVYLEDEEDVELDPYETEHWYWFSDTGKCAKADTTKYINGQYYHFGEGRYMDSGWFGGYASAPESDPDAAKTGLTTATGRLATGWVKKAEDGTDDEYWYYLVNVRGADGRVRATVPFNRNGEGKAKDAAFVNGKGETDEWTDDKVYAARSINNKIYLFDYYGHMITGIVTAKTGVASDVEGFNGAWVYNSSGNVMQDPNVSGAGSWYYLDPENVYYFNNVAGSSEGQMAKNGRVTVNVDGETYYYHFSPDGSAYTSEIVSGVLYGKDGKRIQSDAGWMAVIVDGEEIAKLAAKKYPNSEESGILYTVGGVDYVIPDGSVIVVNSSGRVRTTDKSTVRIDGENFTITFQPDGAADKAVSSEKDENPYFDYVDGKKTQVKPVSITASVK